MTIKKGLAVHNSSAELVHKLMDDGEAQIGKTGKDVVLKGTVKLDGVTSFGDEMGIAGMLNDMVSETEVLTADLATETGRAAAAEGVNAAAITAEASTARLAESTNATAISDEAATARAAEQANAAAVVTEAGLARAAESTLTTNLATETARMDAVLLAADADKDSFAEIVTLINSVDTSNDDALAGYVLSNNLALAAEATTARAAEQANAAAVVTEAGLARAAEAQNAGDITSEAATARAAEQANAAAVVTEAGLARAAESTLTTNLATETARMDAVLLAADADKDSFAEIVTLINSVDATNDSTFAGYVASNDAALLLETTTARAAEGVNAAAVVTEAGLARAAEAQNAGDITSEAATARAAEQANAAAITSEAATARAAEQANAADITSEAATARAAEQANAADIAAETASRISEDALLATQVQSLAADGMSMTLSGLATVNQLVSSGTIKVGSLDQLALEDGTDYPREGSELPVGDATADAAYAARMQQFNGTFFYYSGGTANAGEGNATAPFVDGNKWYFCEDGTWFPSPFFTEE